MARILALSFLYLAGAATCLAPYKDHPVHQEVDVAIIGAGLSGLAAGRALQQAGKKIMIEGVLVEDGKICLTGHG